MHIISEAADTSSVFSSFYTPPHYSGGLLCFQVGYPCGCSFVVCLSVFSLLDGNLSKYQWIVTKLDMCIDIAELWFWIANGQISSFLKKLSACHMIVADYYHFTFLFLLK